MAAGPSSALILLVLAGVIAFLFLEPRNKVLAAFLVLSSAFDLVPTVVYGFLVRDLGVILLMITWVQLLTRRRVIKVPPVFLVRAIQGLIGWAAVCVAYGILIDGYPMLLTLKAARHLILGYCSFFVFLRLYETDPGAFQHLMKWFYLATWVLMPIVLVQYISGELIFNGLIREYEGVIRALPIFLPLCLMFTWYILSRLLGGQRVLAHEKAYVALALGVTALTYTRGIYLAGIAVFLVMLVMLARSGRLMANRTLGYLGVLALGLAILIASGAMDRVVNRFLSGVSVIRGDEPVLGSFVRDVDTFTGRMQLAGERITLVVNRNPLVGFAFVHEMLVPNQLRNSLRYASPVDTPELQKMYAAGMPYVMSLHSVDIGWATVVVDTGLVGLLLMGAVLGGVLIQFIRAVTLRRLGSEDYFWSVGLFLELVMLGLLMFNGNPYVDNVHFVCFFLASFVLCSSGVRSDQRSVIGLRQTAR